MKSTREKSEENGVDDTEIMQKKFDEAVETIDAIRARLDELESGLRNNNGLLHRLSGKLVGAFDDQAKARPLALFLSTVVAGIVAARLLRH